MEVRQLIPEGLAAIPPGPELARALADLEPSRLSGFDCVAADEVRAALVLTRRAAEAQLWVAYDLVTRLPQAPELTTGQLIEKIKKLAISVDPDWARRRYEQALAERKVVGYRNADGSANLSGYNLPVDRVAAASGHIDALAKATKRAGDHRPTECTGPAPEAGEGVRSTPPIPHWRARGPVFCDNDLSAYSGKPRPGYQAMLDAIDAGPHPGHTGPVRSEPAVSGWRQRRWPAIAPEEQWRP